DSENTLCENGSSLTNLTESPSLTLSFLVEKALPFCTTTCSAAIAEPIVSSTAAHTIVLPSLLITTLLVSFRFAGLLHHRRHTLQHPRRRVRQGRRGTVQQLRMRMSRLQSTVQRADVAIHFPHAAGLAVEGRAEALHVARHRLDQALVVRGR